jgi:hypothetical protein
MRFQLALIVVLTALTWTFFSLMTPESPLGANGTIVVLVIWASIVLGGNWVWRRICPRAKP